MSQKSEIAHYTWADKIAGELLQRGKKHVAHGMWTPSGYFHIGNARGELLVPAMVARAVKDAGGSARTHFLADDFDDMDKVPAGIDVDAEKYKEFLGKPLREIPSPMKGYDSWASFFTDQALGGIERLGEKPKFYSVYDEYRKGTYDKAIKIVLDNAGKVRDLWEIITETHKPENWLPVMVVCESCGRSATTKAVSWSGKNLAYVCSEPREYAKPCNHSGEIIPHKGNVKLPWRVHWPATWFVFGTTFESGGKDHFTKGGSVDTGRAFMKEVFNVEQPLLIGTEFIQLGGEKISGSRGNVITPEHWLEVADAELLRFMMISYQPGTAIDFDMHGGKLFLLEQRYHEAEQVYYGEKSLGEKRDAQLRREYMLSQVKKAPKGMPVQLDYSLLATVVQMYPHKNIGKIIELLRSLKALKKENLAKDDENRISAKINHARAWVSRYAPDDMKLKLNEAAPAMDLTEQETDAVFTLSNELLKEWDEAGLQSRIYEIARENDVEPKRFFQILYRMLLSRDHGPRLGHFIVIVGKEKIRAILDTLKK
ncbi:MAG: lysine--tRNA ligase [Candidatus Aenigmarchaeota archaeon]|nr:lysine--tRNA ligase [Candidatus Aenigmarchaeota archaeon]